MKTCPACGQPMPALNRDGQPRRYCSRACSWTNLDAGKHNTFPKIRDLYAEEVEHLTLCGSAPHAILKALDVTPGNLARALQREGRYDLARPFDRIHRAEQDTPEFRTRRAAQRRALKARKAMAA